MKILVVDDDAEIVNLIALSLESKFDVEVVRAQSGTEAIQLLDNDSEIHHIISDYHMPHGSGGELFTYTQSLPRSISFLLCSSFTPSDYPEFLGKELAGYLQKPFFWEELVTTIQTAFQLNLSSQTDGGFHPVRLASLKHLQLLRADVFLKISDQKFVKVFRSGDVFTLEDYDRYQARNLMTLYLRTEDYEHFLKDLTESIHLLTEAKEMSWKKNYEVLEDAHHSVYDAVKVLGFSKEAQELAKSAAQLAVKSVMSQPKISVMLSHRQSGSAHFLNAHSIFLAFISGLLALEMGWKTESVCYSLALAALLHDIAIEDHLLAMIELYLHSHQNFQSFDPEQMKRLMKHPEESANIAKLIPALPEEVYLLILHHHERPDGEGFPNKLKPSEVPPLSALFIIAQDLANYIWLHDQASNMHDFLEEHGSYYREEPYSKILACLKDFDTT